MDPIADMLSRIKNAAAADKTSVTVSYSKLKMAIAERLVERGYIASATLAGEVPHKAIEIELAYGKAGAPLIHQAKRVSKSSRRVYEKAKNLKPVKHGYGDLVISTPQGILVDREAREQNIGGELLFEIW